MDWKIETTPEAVKDFKKLDNSIYQLIKNYIYNKISTSADPGYFGKPLNRNLKNRWSYRVGNYRIVCRIDFNTKTVLVTKVEHRSTVYDD